MENGAQSRLAFILELLKRGTVQLQLLPPQASSPAEKKTVLKTRFYAKIDKNGMAVAVLTTTGFLVCGIKNKEILHRD